MYINRMVVSFKRRYSRHYEKADRHLHPCTILCRVTINGIPASDFSTKQHLLPQHWDQERQVAFDFCPDAELINKALQKLRARLDVLWNRYEYDDVPVTADQIVSEYLTRKKLAVHAADGLPLPKRAAKPKKTTISIDDLLARHLTYLNGQVIEYADDEQPRQDGRIIEVTYKVYSRYTKNILRYIEATRTIERPTMPATDLDAIWMNGLLQFMRAANYDGYYTAKHLYYIKTTLDWGINEKLLQYNPVSTYSIDRADDDNELIFLYDDEIVRFESADFSTMIGVSVLAPMLDRVRDAWLAMAEIGQHYSDYKTFVRKPTTYVKVVHGIRFFRKRRRKTHQWALVPISDKLRALEVKYGGFENLPAPCNKTMNVYLKVIAAVVGIDKNITTKSARKTFADLAINEEELDLDTVARMMGLSSTQYIQKYARIDERRIIKKKGLTPTTESANNK